MRSTKKRKNLPQGNFSIPPEERWKTEAATGFPATPQKNLTCAEGSVGRTELSELAHAQYSW